MLRKLVLKQELEPDLLVSNRSDKKLKKHIIIILYLLISFIAFNCTEFETENTQVKTEEQPDQERQFREHRKSMLSSFAAFFLSHT